MKRVDAVDAEVMVDLTSCVPMVFLFSPGGLALLRCHS